MLVLFAAKKHMFLMLVLKLIAGIEPRHYLPKELQRTY
ncbi:Hypothetical protein PMT_2501 [Prochlorococcus marinus str. MIT 9313]|uniref:Uncharacterized protein n=1 Tax=Prochlorococcus marinus (strain MIT 9313) TaxID=74547 RepID=B9ERY5_PROMM|nr:Hypothetical protein PMT_2495 [Prochlorococcus marinus str. MIT 9313]CAX32019.1 Hypothetical protein PMT_2501 [Prochlorococcus marinus str. MIT 9313]